MIVAGSVAFSQLLAFTGITRGIVETATNLPVTPTIIIASILCLLILMGTMIEQISMIMIGVPIFMPVATALGYDPIWFGLLMLLCITLGLITPPFGIVLYAVSSISGCNIEDIAKEALPYIILDVGVLLLITYFPGFTLFFPRVFGLVQRNGKPVAERRWTYCLCVLLTRRFKLEDMRAKIAGVLQNQDERR